MFNSKRARSKEPRELAPGETEDLKAVGKDAAVTLKKAGPGAESLKSAGAESLKSAGAESLKSAGTNSLKSKVPPALTPKRRQTTPPDGATIRQQFEAVRRYAAEPRLGVGIGSEPRRGAGEDPSRLLIGRDITFKGQIGDCETLVIEGKVGASAKCHSFQVQEDGVYDGEIECETAEICGRVEGRIRIRGRLTIRSAGQLSGEITYGELDIATGGCLSGDIRHEPVAEETAKEDKTAPRAPSPSPLNPPVAAQAAPNAPSNLPDPADVGPQRQTPTIGAADPVGAAADVADPAIDTPVGEEMPLAVGTAGARP